MSNSWQHSGSRWEPAPGTGAPPSPHSATPAVPVSEQEKLVTDRPPARRTRRSAAVLAAVVAMITVGLVATWTALAPAVGDLVARATEPAPAASADGSGRQGQQARDDRTGDDPRADDPRADNHRGDDHRRSDDDRRRSDDDEDRPS